MTMLDKRNPAMSSITSSSCSSSSSASSCSSSGNRPSDGTKPISQDKDVNLSAYLDDRIYVPSFATDQAMCGQFEYARRLYDSWINAKCEPDDYRIFFNRAICNYELEDYEKALSDVNVAIKLHEKWPKGHYVKGKILSEMRKFQSAEDSFLVSLKLDGYENADTEARIRKNIFMALVNDGFDVMKADHASAKQATYDDAKDYLTSGGFDQSLEMSRSAKAAKLTELNRKVGRILPPVWFNGRKSVSSRRMTSY